MTNPIEIQLQPVRVRQAYSTAVKWGVYGLLAGSIAAAFFAGFRFGAELNVSPFWGLALVAAGPILGALAGFVFRNGFHSAASVVDAHYKLKDRAQTALLFSRQAQRTPLHELQVADAMDHLSKIDARQVVPMQSPGLLPAAVGATLAAGLLLVLTWNIGPGEAVAMEANAVIVEQAEILDKSLEELEEAVREEPNTELQKLLKELKEKIEELKEPGVDPREALAKLSEMQAGLEALQREYSAGDIDAELKSMGEALTLSQDMAAAGKALSEGAFEKAAAELEKLELPDLDRKTAKSLEEKLKKASDKLGGKGMAAMSQATGEMAEGTGAGDKSKFKEGSKKLGSGLKKQARRKKINDLLKKQCKTLGECKNCCCEGNCESEGKKTGSPSNNWGKGTAGKPGGEKTSPLGKGRNEQVTGKMNDSGESDIETEHTAEGAQEAQRQFTERFAQFQKESEAVLDSEPIPLGHRQTIRKYFELIRPSNAEMDKVAPKSTTAEPAADAAPATDAAANADAASSEPAASN